MKTEMADLYKLPKTQRPALIVIVRHAESERNKAKKGNTYFADEEARKIVKGIPDHKIPITAKGRDQAKKTGNFIRKKFGTFDYAYHSGYKRTKDTLELILDAYPEKERKQIRKRKNPFIRERDAGYTYDMTTAEAEKYFPWLRKYWKMIGGFFACPPGGESLAQATQRVYLFLNMLFRDRAGKRLLIVTHGGTIRCIRFLLEHWGYSRALKWPPGQSPENCGITVYEYNDSKKRLILKEYNTIGY